MKIGALTLFKRQHSNFEPARSILLAAWHWKWSRTWRWGFVWHPHNKYSKRTTYFMLVHKGRGFNFHCGLNLPVIGDFSIQTQPNQDMRIKPAQEQEKQ